MASFLRNAKASLFYIGFTFLAGCNQSDNQLKNEQNKLAINDNEAKAIVSHYARAVA